MDCPAILSFSGDARLVHSVVILTDWIHTLIVKRAGRRFCVAFTMCFHYWPYHVVLFATDLVLLKRTSYFTRLSNMKGPHALYA